MHVMIDLETLGTAPGSVILSIGAVLFDPATGDVGAQVFRTAPAKPAPYTYAFYTNVDPESCKAFGLTADPKTVAWWEKQSPEAKAALLTDRQPLSETLRAFASWFRAVGANEVWSYGANFDVVLLEEASRRVEQVLTRGVGALPHLHMPWGYRDVRCARTVMALADVTADLSGRVKHNALDDAVAQAEAICEAYLRLGLASNYTASDVLGAVSVMPASQVGPETFLGGLLKGPVDDVFDAAIRIRARDPFSKHLHFTAPDGPAVADGPRGPEIAPDLHADAEGRN